MLTLTEKTSLQPTLSLYLGGSGILAGESLLRQMEILSADERQLIEPFFIDSQEPAIIDHARARHYCYQNLGQFFEPIYQEFSEERFPENLGVSPVINSCEGCGVTRIFGAASLVANRDDFANLIEQSVARLRKRRRESTQPLQVFITASACGGTGAGMILDAAALVRNFFRERGENPRIFFFLVGPSVYLDDPTIPLREDQRDRMRASTYALLKELHHFAQGNPFRSAYRLRDKVIEIGNARDDDRLFDWVYFLDGRPEQGGSTRTLAEVAWTIAEVQLHLAVTEVGRKVAEAMPNQREERLRGFAIDFVHADNKDRLTDAARKRLETSSRRTFLASFALRNVRFPTEEIKKWFRWGWVRGGLTQLLDGRPIEGDQAAIDEFDRLLGWKDGVVQPEGLLVDLGLSREQLLSRTGSDADPSRGIVAAPSPTAVPQRVVEAAEAAARVAASVVAEIKADASLVQQAQAAEPDGRSTAALMESAAARWSRAWAGELVDGGRIAERLWALATNPPNGRGLRFLDGLIVHAADQLTKLAGKAKEKPDLARIEDAIDEIMQLAGTLRKRSTREEGLRFRVRKLMSVGDGTSAYSADVQNKSRGLARRLEQFRSELIELRGAHIARRLAPFAWLDAARSLKRWREEVLAPTITAAQNASTLADNEWKLARNALVVHQGVNRRGRWQAHTTVQIADDELLQAFGRELSTVLAEDLVITPLREEGISRERQRLTVRTLSSFERAPIVDLLYRHVEVETRRALTFLDNGWMLEDVGARLQTTAAKALDDGSEPLVSFSRASVGQQLHGFLLTPERLILPEPFGRRLERMNRLVSRDPLQMGIVTFTFGIPPNALEGMSDLFAQYTIHIGDQARNKAQDRFPLHVFRHAAESFDEPYSPLAFQASEGLVQSLLAAARLLWPSDGGIRLDVRQFDEQSLKTDWNQYIELTEKVLQRLLRRRDEAERLLGGGAFPELERLYNSRRYRSAETWAASPHAGDRGGNGSSPEAPAD